MRMGKHRAPASVGARAPSRSVAAPPRPTAGSVSQLARPARGPRGGRGPLPSLSRGSPGQPFVRGSLVREVTLSGSHGVDIVTLLLRRRQHSSGGGPGDFRILGGRSLLTVMRVLGVVSAACWLRRRRFHSSVTIARRRGQTTPTERGSRMFSSSSLRARADAAGVARPVRLLTVGLAVTAVFAVLSSTAGAAIGGDALRLSAREGP